MESNTNKNHLKGKEKFMANYLSANDERQDLLKSDYPYFDNRIDCLSIKRYYRINDNTFKMVTLFNPTEFGINQLKERNKITMGIKEKLQAINSGNGNAKPINAVSLKDKVKEKSFNEKSDLNLNKFAEVETLRQTINDQSVLIQDLINDIKDLSKCIYENNSLIAIIGKDQKSCLNAINALHAKSINTAKTDKKDPAINNQKVITRKANNKGSFLTDQSIDQDTYQGIYEHFKGYFNHKFAKSGKADQLPEFIFFINGIDFSNGDTIDQSCRAIWQSYRADNNSMLFAPNSMKLAIDSLIKTGKDLDLIKGSNKLDQSKNPTIVKDFEYWANLLQVDKPIIAEIVSLIKAEKLTDTTKGLIIEHLQDHCNDLDKVKVSHIDEFMEYLNNTNFI